MQISTQVEASIALNHIDKHILSAKMGVPIRTLNYKLANGSWTYSELFDLFKVLKISDDNILKFFGR